MAKPLYEASKGLDMEPLDWTGNLQTAFDQIKTALISAPALGIPDLNKTFTLPQKNRELPWEFSPKK